MYLFISRYVFFFKQKTAYEMRISDWSSDVCSSDLRMLQKAGLDFTILEAGDHASGSWRAYFDSLTLFSPTAYSALPDRAMPGDPEAYPRRDAVADYLEDYAAHFALPIRYGARVAAVEPTNEGGFVVGLESGGAKI